MRNPKSALVYLRPMRLLCVRETGPYHVSIPKAWERLVCWLRENELYRPVGRGYGLAHDNPGEAGAQSCRYDAGVEVPAAFAGRAMSGVPMLTLPGGAYACRRIKGNYEGMKGVVAGVYSAFAPLPGLSIDTTRPVVTIYMDNPDRNLEHELRADICVPLSVVGGHEWPVAAIA